MTTQQKYGGLNKRFEKRAAVLRSVGFKYRIVCEGVAVFTRIKYNRERNIAAASVMHCDKAHWLDTLAQYLK